MKGFKKQFYLSAPLLLAAIFGNSYAATPVDLNSQTITFLRDFLSPTMGAKDVIKIKEINRSLDFQQTLHIRIQETYQSYAVWGADAVVHIPHGKLNSSLSSALSNTPSNASMDGTFYRDIQKDLANTPASIFQQAQMKKAMEFIINEY